MKDIHLQNDNVPRFQLSTYMDLPYSTGAYKDTQLKSTKTKIEPPKTLTTCNWTAQLAKMTAEALVSGHCSKEDQTEFHKYDSVTSSLQTLKGNEASRHVLINLAHERATEIRTNRH